MRTRTWLNLRFKHTSITHFLGTRHHTAPSIVSEEGRFCSWCDYILATMVEAKKSGPILNGLSISTLKKNYPLIPLFVIVGLAITGSALYTLRLALRNPDVTWSVKKNPEPWQEYANKSYKLYTTDTTPRSSPAPKY